MYFRTSVDGLTWTSDRKLAGIKEAGKDKSGHYQVSNRYGEKVSTFFNRHPDGNVDKRTDLYYIQTFRLWKDLDEYSGRYSGDPFGER